jgi:hypothetical protein
MLAKQTIIEASKSNTTSQHHDPTGCWKFTEITYNDGSKGIGKVLVPPAGTPPSASEIPMAAAMPTTEQHDIEAGVLVVPKTGHFSPTAGPIPHAPAPFTLRRSHICCGVCCDCRRAVIIIDLISIILAIIAISFAAHVERNPEDYEDENGDSTIEWYKNEDVTFGALLAYSLVGILLLVIAMTGAVYFIGCSVWFGLVYHLLSVVGSLIMLNPVGIILGILFAYPHAVLINEIKRGVMSEARYPIESHSCCCVNQFPQRVV